MKYCFYLLSTSVVFIQGCANLKRHSSPDEILHTINFQDLDSSVAVHEDFYTFSNGRWLEKTKIPEDKGSWGKMQEVFLENLSKLEFLMDSLSACNFEKGSGKQIISDYYASLIDMEQRNMLGKQPLLVEMERIDSIQTKASLAKQIAAYDNKGIRSLWAVVVGADLKKPDRQVYLINQNGLSIPNNYYFNKKYSEQLKKFSTYVFESFLLFDKDSLSALEGCKAVLKIESRLSTALLPKNDLRNPDVVYNRKTNEELSEILNVMGWSNYAETRNIQSFEYAIVQNPKLLKRINELFETIDLTTWKYYLKWKVYWSYAPLLDEKCKKLYNDFYVKYLRGVDKEMPIKMEALKSLTKSNLRHLLGKCFVEEFFSQEAKDHVDEMVDNISKVFEQRISQLSWMSEETKTAAIDKLNKVERKLGYPNTWKDYSHLNIDRKKYLHNVFEVVEASVSENMNSIHGDKETDQWVNPAHDMNASYVASRNEIVFPAGIMQRPYFSNSSEEALNYAGIGMVIGHELVHGFDDNGSKFSADGSFENWWTSADRDRFIEQTKILGNTYSQFCPFEDQCVNSELTMGENIADLGGLRIAFRAYQLTDEYKSGKIINGYTPSQRFFIAFAQLWAMKYRSETLKKSLALDYHSPNIYRVNGSLMNCPEFFEAFNIPEGAKMRNPKSQIPSLW